MGLQFDSVNGRSLKERDLVFIVYISVCKGLNKDSIAQWMFCRKKAVLVTKGTSLQVLEASQGGLQPVVGARCYSMFLSSIFEPFSCLKNMVFLIVLNF